MVGRSPDGLVTFVRHALPGERVRCVVTETTARFLRADAIEILEASPDRIVPSCTHAGPGGCGGCDYSHATLVAQRRMKAQLVAEQLRRVAKVEVDVHVEPATKGDDGFGWRTSIRMDVDSDGRPCFHANRSDQLIPIDACPIASPTIARTGVIGGRFPGMAEVACFGHPDADHPLVQFTATPAGFAQIPEVDDAAVRIDGEVHVGPARATVTVGKLHYAVSPDSFFQVHRAAARTLVHAVLDAAAVRPGDHVADLYSGVGLFTVALAEAVGRDGSVVAIERSSSAVADAKRNVRHLPQVQLVASAVTASVVSDLLPGTEVVVVDPAREGLGKGVVDALCTLAPGLHTIVVVSCDPSTFARDLAKAAEHGWGLESLRCFDLFPQTEHVELVGVLKPQVRATA